MPASILNFACLGSGINNTGVSLPVVGDILSSAESVLNELTDHFQIEKVMSIYIS